MKTIYQILLTLFITLNTSWALDNFVCQCKATGPGFEVLNKEKKALDKICSYSCNCIAWNTTIDSKTKNSVATQVIADIKLDAKDLPSSARSRETWDSGSNVCHGQYSYKSNLGDPAWKIKVKFDTFHLNTAGEVLYAEDHRREIAMGISEVGFKFTPKAPEIMQSLKDQLKKY